MNNMSQNAMKKNCDNFIVFASTNEMLDLCNNNSEFYAACIFHYINDANEYIEYLLSLPDLGITKIIPCNVNYTVYFSNGSVLYVMVDMDTFKAHRVNMVMYQAMVKHTFIKMVWEPMLIDYN